MIGDPIPKQSEIEQLTKNMSIREKSLRYIRGSLKWDHERFYKKADWFNMPQEESYCWIEEETDKLSKENLGLTTLEMYDSCFFLPEEARKKKEQQLLEGIELCNQEIEKIEKEIDGVLK